MKLISTLLISFLFVCSSYAQTGMWTCMGVDHIINQKGVYGVKGLSASSNKPGRRHYSNTWKDKNGNLWLFGGYGYSAQSLAHLNDLWKFDPTTNQWTW